MQVPWAEGVREPGGVEGLVESAEVADDVEADVEPGLNVARASDHPVGLEEEGGFDACLVAGGAVRGGAARGGCSFAVAHVGVLVLW